MNYIKKRKWIKPFKRNGKLVKGHYRVYYYKVPAHLVPSKKKAPTPKQKKDLYQQLNFPKKNQYHCVKCKYNHYYWSKLGKAHIKEKLKVEGKERYKYLAYFKALKAPNSPLSKGYYQWKKSREGGKI